MKKIVAGLLLATVMLSVFSGCGDKKKGVSKEVYEIGLKAVEVTDQYLDLKLTSEKAYEQLKALSAEVAALGEKGQETGLIRLCIGGIRDSLGTHVPQDTSFKVDPKDVKRWRNSLAKELGIKERK